MKYIVKTVPDRKLGKYDGMNAAAAKELGFGHHLRPNEIWVSDKAKGKYREQVIAHEKIEHYHMAKRGLPYKRADAIAEGFDKHVK